MFSVSVPGKVILMGEHAVVYGKPALVAAVNRRMTISIEKLSVGISSPKESGTDSYVHHILQTCEEACHLSLENSIRLHIHSSIPSGYHLGSSGSLAAGIVGAVFLYAGIPFDRDRMVGIAQQAEHFIHSVSSGVDPAIALTGGLLWYRKNSDGAKDMKVLSSEKLKSLDHFFLIDTGKPKESTGEMVTQVAQLYKEKSSEMKAYMDENERQMKRIMEAIEAENEKDFIDAMKKGEQTLEGMGVVPDTVKPCIREIEANGGTAKITGGGGKTDGAGFILCYHNDRKTVETIAKKFRFSVASVTLGEEGLRVEKK